MAHKTNTSFLLRSRARVAVLTAAIFLTSMIASSKAHADLLESDRAAITAAYEEMNNAFARHDCTGVMTFFTPDYEEVDNSGKTTNRDQAQRHVRDQSAQVKSMQTRYTVLNCELVPTGVEVEIRAHTDGSGEKRVLFAHLHGSFSNDLWVRDLWVDTPAGWRIKHRLTLQNDTHISPF